MRPAATMTAEGTAERAPGTRRWTGSGWTLGHYRCPMASDGPGADVTSARGSGRAQQRAWTQTPSQGDGRCDLHVISGQHGTRRVTAAATAISPVLPAERPPWVGLGTPPGTPRGTGQHSAHLARPLLPGTPGEGRTSPPALAAGCPAGCPAPRSPATPVGFQRKRALRTDASTRTRQAGCRRDQGRPV